MAFLADFRAAHLITAAAALTARKGKTTYLEVHPWRSNRDGAPLTGHIPGSFITSITTHFAGTAARTSGHLPLPNPADLAQTAAGWGVDTDSTIVVYTRRAAEFSTAARAWFTLRWAGFRDVRVLDGQLPAWADAGGPLGDAAPPRRHASEPTLIGGMLPTLDADAAAAIARNGSLLDARPFSAYAGHDDDPRTGHIPGAVSAPSAELVTDGHLRHPADIRKWFLRHRAIGQLTGAYCGGGVGSTTTAFAAATIGETLPLYIASWSGWSANPDAAVEQGSGQSHLAHTDC